MRRWEDGKMGRWEDEKMGQFLKNNKFIKWR
jgi:hypothetical protein